jgi:PAS domain S-box-containing protein
MVDENANGHAGSEAQAAFSQVCADRAFASLARAGAPVLAAEGASLRVVFANAAALALFGAPDCPELTRLLFDAGSVFADPLSRVAQSLSPGGAPRVERLLLPAGWATEAVTFLCRRTASAAPVLILAALGRRKPIARGAFFLPPSPSPPAPAAGETAKVEGPVEAAPRVASSPDFLAFKTEMERRFPGLPPARFLWRTDANLVITEITPPLADIVGPGCADLVGRDFLEAARALGLDKRGELEQALRSRATFSRVDLDWPIENAGAVAPVTLGGLPAFGRLQAFDGWRGFGVIQLDGVREAPDVFAPWRMDTGAGASPQAEAAPPPAAVAATPEFTGVVVPLRPLAGWTPPQGDPREDARRGDDDDSALVALAPHERNAFREIARRLGARGDETVRAALSEAAEILDKDLGEDPEGAEPPEAARVRSEPGAPFDTAFADALAVGVVVQRGDKALYANRVLLDWLGVAEFGAFERGGGLASFCKRPPDFAAKPRQTLILRPRPGAQRSETFAVDAQRAPIVWDGGGADCLTLSRPSAAALRQRAGILESGLRQREAEVDEILTIIETAGDAFILVNGDGVVLGLNRPAESLFGYGRDEIAGENFNRLLDRESAAAALEGFARLKSGERTGARDVTGRNRRGDALVLSLIFGSLGWASNGKYCLVFREAAHAGGAMAEERDRARSDNQAKSELLAQVAHEIRTPLNAILGFAEVIAEERFGPVGNARYKEYVKDIHASGAHVLSLVNDLLDLSKIEAGKVELTFAAVDANRVVAECVAMIQPQANRDKVITRLALASRLPAILADERSLRQIVLNLLANAVRYNEPGGQVIVSTALSDPRHAVLRIKDTGVGMSESELGKAMEPFGQVGPERGAGGTGLGLPLTKALAEANRAGFVIRSRKNEGTLVEVVFPLAPEAAETALAGRAG